jgi:ABC-2 type transport system permease protein
MIQTQIALIKRELWEHRSLYVVPLVLALVVSLTSVTGQVAVSSFGQQVDVAILGATNLGETERAAAINVLMIAVSWIFVMTMGIITIFYALDALYAERKDKSILFWRSLPVTDAETILSKLLTAAIVIPAITFVVVALTHVVVLTISSIWVGMRGADAWQLIWTAAPLFDNWAATFIVMLALSLWVAPFVGWFLFVSAFAKRSPFLFAFLPLVIIPMLERILLGSTVFAEMLMARAPFRVPVFQNLSFDNLQAGTEEDIVRLAESGVSLLSLIDIGRFLGSLSVWLGLAVCGLFCTAAIYVRRYRDES